jgi:hypothetical protein
MTLREMILSAGLLLCFTFLYGQKNIKAPTADAVLTKAVQSFDLVNDLTTTIDVDIQMERLQIPKMHATMYFKKPDKIHFASQAFLFVPKEGVVWNPSILKERYTPASCQIDTIDNNVHYKILLVAKDASVHLQRLTAWINAENWAIRKIESLPYEGRTLVLNFFSILVQEKFWLPSKTVANFTSVGGSPGGNELIEMKKQALDIPQGPSLRNGMLTIVYSDYKVNSGIDDSVFEEKKK